MPITRTPMIDDDGSGTTGTIINAAWKTQLYDQIDGLGKTIDVPYAAADYSGSGTLVVNFPADAVKSNYYAVVGNTVWWTVMIYGGQLTSGVGSELHFKVPRGFAFSRDIYAPVVLWQNVTPPAVRWMSGYLMYTTAPDPTIVKILRLDEVALSIGSLYLGFQINLAFA